MVMKIKEVTYAKSGVIAKAAYENLRPSYSFTAELDKEDNVEDVLKHLKGIVDNQFELDEYTAKVSLVEKQFANMRLYPVNGFKYPSITSVLGWDKDWYISEGELSQYGAIGTIIHKVFEDAIINYQKTGELIWKEPEEFPELQKEISMVRGGSLQLDWNDYSYKTFGNEYIPKLGKICAMEETVANDEIKTAGTLDILAPFGDKLSIIDLKSGAYDFRQLAFYGNTWSVLNGKDVEQMVIFPLGKTDNKSGYKKPIINTDIAGEWKEMLKARETFKKRFGI
jgi:hypothetical protein